MCEHLLQANELNEHLLAETREQFYLRYSVIDEEDIIEWGNYLEPNPKPGSIQRKQLYSKAVRSIAIVRLLELVRRVDHVRTDHHHPFVGFLRLYDRWSLDHAVSPIINVEQYGTAEGQHHLHEQYERSSHRFVIGELSFGGNVNDLLLTLIQIVLRRFRPSPCFLGRARKRSIWK